MIIKPTYTMSRSDMAIQTMFNLMGWQRTTDVSDADLVVFPGGADVNPFLYGEKRHPTTQIDYFSDMQDLACLKKCGDKQPKVGICRGGQFLNVMVGNGSLYQHVSDHAIALLHEMRLMNDIEGFSKSVDVTSTHHQMMIPGPGGDVLYAANLAMEKNRAEDVTKYTNEHRDNIWDDVEVILYEDRNCLCYQPHPEYTTKGNYYNREVFLGLIDRYFMEDGPQKVKMWENFYNIYPRPS